MPAKAAAVVTVGADGESLLLDQATDRLHLLNQSATLLWQCFDGRSSIATLAFDIAEVLGVPFERVLADALEVTGGLLEEGLVVDAASSAEAWPEPAAVASGEAVDVGLRVLAEPPNG